MHRTCWGQLCAWTMIVASACTSPPATHGPPATPSVDATHSVAMGHVQIFIKERDVTQDCTLTLKDTDPDEISVKPEASGWVFVPVARGSVRIAAVDCGPKTQLETLDFHVPPDGRPTYFGHVRLQLPEPTRELSSQNAEAIGAGMRAAPPTLTGAVVATGVGLLATALLSQSVAAGPAKVEVEDKSPEATELYSARSLRSPNTLAVSLAGSVFLGGPDLSPSVQKAGEVVYTEANLGGVTLTWLAAPDQTQPRAALRVQRFVRKDVPCTSIKLSVDGRELVIPAASKTVRASAILKQFVQGELDSQAIQDVASAKRVLVDVCGSTRAFSELARTATTNFAKAYSALPASARPIADVAVAAPAPSQVQTRAAVSR
jgi:hypothetical protein